MDLMLCLLGAANRGGQHIGRRSTYFRAFR